MLLLSGACSTDRDPGDLFAPDEVGILVIDAVLIVGEWPPDMFLTRTLSPSDAFSFGAVGVEDAEIAIYADGELAARYRPVRESPGWYVATLSFGQIRPSTTYRLEVETAAGEVLRATTTTPAAFRVDEWVLLDSDDGSVIRRLSRFEEHGDSLYEQPENTLVYQQGLLEARFDRGDHIAFQIGLASLDKDSPFVIDPDFFDQGDFDDLEREVASPPFDAPDGSVRLPWFAIYFEGRYLTRVFALDRNWYDLARSLPDFSGGGQGFGGQAGDDFDRPIFHVEGGIGLFGSAAADSVGFTILPGN
jgi:hypothetical protein